MISGVNFQVWGKPPSPVHRIHALRLLLNVISRAAALRVASNEMSFISIHTCPMPTEGI